MSRPNIVGPTALWREIKNKKVKSNDGKYLGKIIEISENHLRIQKGGFRKIRFWIPKDLADVYDGRFLWVVASQKDIYDKFLYGEEPSEEKYKMQGGLFANKNEAGIVDKRMIGIPTKSNLSEPYKNIRDT